MAQDHQDHNMALFLQTLFCDVAVAKYTIMWQHRFFLYCFHFFLLMNSSLKSEDLHIKYVLFCLWADGPICFAVLSFINIKSTMLAYVFKLLILKTLSKETFSQIIFLKSWNHSAKAAWLLKRPPMSPTIWQYYYLLLTNFCLASYKKIPQCITRPSPIHCGGKSWHICFILTWAWICNRLRSP